LTTIDSAVRLLRDSNLVWSSDFSDVRLTLALLLEESGQSADLGVKAKALLVASQLTNPVATLTHKHYSLGLETRA
jgi:hypothetical protein